MLSELNSVRRTPELDSTAEDGEGEREHHFSGPKLTSIHECPEIPRDPTQVRWVNSY